jgi:hypothetical protein
LPSRRFGHGHNLPCRAPPANGMSGANHRQ